MTKENIIVNGVEYTPVIKVDKWKLPEYEDGSEWVATGFDEVVVRDSNKYYTTSGRRRATEALAERCAKASKERDLLEAYRDHLEPDWIDEKGKVMFYIYSSNNKYFTDLSIFLRTVGAVYGSKETMQKICDALNNKEISLD